MKEEELYFKKTYGSDSTYCELYKYMTSDLHMNICKLLYVPENLEEVSKSMKKILINPPEGKNFEGM